MIDQEGRLYAHAWVVSAADENFAKSCCWTGFETATFLCCLSCTTREHERDRAMIAQPFWKKLAAVRLNPVSFGSVLNETTKHGLHRCGEACEGRDDLPSRRGNHGRGDPVPVVSTTNSVRVARRFSARQCPTFKRQSASLKTTTRVCKCFETETDRGSEKTGTPGTGTGRVSDRGYT